MSALMTSLFVVFLLFANAVKCDVDEDDDDFRGGLLVTTTNQWVSGSSEKVCVAAHGLGTSVDVTVRLQRSERTYRRREPGPPVIYSQASLVLPTGGSRCVSVPLSVDASVTRANLTVTAETSDVTPYRFHRHGIINIRHDNLFTFIETDKPVYKPSDTVRIRLLSLFGPDMKVVTDPVTSLYVEDPTRTRIMQWTNITNRDGLIDVEMKLSDEPPLGEWTVRAVVSGQEKSRQFTVKEYVLPKFEVSVVHPGTVSNNDSIVSWKVCAHYTYGEPVIGKVQSTKACLQEYGLIRPGCVIFNMTELVDGCASFNAEVDWFAKTRYYSTYSLKVVFTAEVVEHGTDVTLNGSREAGVLRDSIIVELDPNNPSNAQYFKPGFPYRGQGSVILVGESLDSSSLVVRVQLSSSAERSWSDTVPVSSDRKFTFTVPAHVTWANRNSSIALRGSVDGKASRTARRTLKPWYSPTDSYLQIDSPGGAVACRSTLVLHVSYTTQTLPAANRFIYVYQVMSRGNIIDTGTNITQLHATSTNPAGQTVYGFTIRLDVTPSMSESFDVVVFHVLEDGETVAGRAHINVLQCFDNQVSMEFADDQVRPGRETSLRVSASDDSSLCAVAVVDKSIELMGTTQQLTKSKLAELISGFQLKRQYTPFYQRGVQETCRRSDNDDDDYEDFYPMPMPRRRERRMIAYPGHYTSNFVDSNEAFLDAGLVTLTDLNLVTRPCRRIRYWYSFHYGMAGAPGGRPGVRRRPSLDALPGLPERMSVTAERGPPLLSVDADDDDDDDDDDDNATHQSPVHRTFFPETWLWRLERMSGQTEKQIAVTVPHTITDWIGSGFCVSSRSGVGVSDKFKVTVFQPFFVSFTLPYSLVRGERVAIPVSVFNYLSAGCLQVKLVVEQNEDFDLIIVNNNNTGDSNTRRSRSAAHMGQLRVCARTTATHSFHLVARQLGHINFTVQATSEPSRDSDEYNSVETVAMATASDIVTRQLLIKCEGKEEEYTKSAYVCTSSDSASNAAGDWSLTLPDDVIADSARAQINVIGDVMGPALGGLDQLLKLPTGCGEQNMLKFAPNIYVLEYLTNTEQLTSSVRDKAVDFLRTGYQRELRYRHRDGSYSAFGESDDEGSLWLTSFVVRSFARARPFIFIDPADLSASIDWIRAQQLENGCFRPVGRVLHKAMKGGLQGDSQTGLTAYVVISLLEANVSRTDETVTNAVSCIAMQQDTDSVYTLSLIYYAYSLYGMDVTYKRNVLDRLQAKAISQGGLTHWESGSSDGARSPAASVEMTSYVLLATLHGLDQSQVTSVLPIVRWLSTQRNSYGGFSSTQDTVLALQALSQFASRIYSPQTAGDVTVTLSGRGLQGRGRSFVVNSSNRLLLQTETRITLPASLHYSLTGSGCALVQAAVKYNRQMVQADQPQAAFTLRARIKRTESSCTTNHLRVCVRYNDNDTASNMAVVAINMVSGWLPDKTSVHALKNSALLGIKRSDIDKDVIQLYFNELDAVERCWTVVLKRTITVSNTRPATVHVYDYYEPEKFAMTEYRTSCGKGSGSDVTPDVGHVVAARTTRQRRRRRNKCPVCALPSGTSVQQVICQARYAYRLSVRDNSMMRLLATLRRPSSDDDSERRHVSVDVKYVIHRRCQCPPLTAGSDVLVLTSTELPANRRRIRLKLKSSSVSVLPYDVDADVMDCPPAA